MLLLASAGGDWLELNVIKEGNRSINPRILKYIQEDEFQQVLQADSVQKWNYGYSIFKHTGDYILQVECQLDYGKWENGAWVFQLDQDYIGDYCGPELVFYRNELYAIGGYGYWRYNADLFRLSTGTRKSEFISVKDQPESFYSGVKYNLKNGVLYWVGIQFDGRIHPKTEFDQGRLLDLEELVWKPIQTEWTDKKLASNFFGPTFVSGRNMDLKDFGILFYGEEGKLGLNALILDKSDLKIYQTPIPFFDVAAIDGFITFEDNHLVLFRNNPADEVVLSIPELLKSAKPVGQITLSDDPDYVWKSKGLVWGLGIISLLIVLGSIWRWKKSQENPTGHHLEAGIKLPGYYASLIECQGQLLSQEKMDQLLELEPQLNHDLRKVHRARKIREINEDFIKIMGYPLIERERDDSDRRMIRYRIAYMISESKEIQNV